LADGVAAEEPNEPSPVGAIFDTTSRGRFDLVIYEDGLLGVKGTYLGVALRGGAVGAGAAGLGQSSGETYEQKRLAAKLASGRERLIREDPNFFIARQVIRDLVLRKRWHGHSLTVKTEAEPQGRTFDWKPRLNDFDEVERVLRTAFPDLVNRE
jgi:hypothetical protein